MTRFDRAKAAVIAYTGDTRLRHDQLRCELDQHHPDAPIAVARVRDIDAAARQPEGDREVEGFLVHHPYTEQAVEEVVYPCWPPRTRAGIP